MEGMEGKSEAGAWGARTFPHVFDFLGHFKLLLKMSRKWFFATNPKTFHGERKLIRNYKMQELKTVTAKNFFVSYTSGWGIEGSRLNVSYGVSGKTSHILTQDFSTEAEAKQFALDMGYLVPHRKTMQIVIGNGAN